MEAQKHVPLVLVADDDEDVRRALSSLLSQEGYEVIALGDGAEALEMVAQAADGTRPRPDVLVLDFCMPGLSGIGILRVVRRFGRIPPTIIITAFPNGSVEAFARNAGAVRVLRKPVTADVLRAAVREALTSTRDQGRADER